jgi:diaminohydroxyphosphoribosylaminopyrimidine deaminase/5-amino-6-(5-phosphoribosylamino)uracil reductase
MNEQELAWMRRALELAERGRGWVEPNPLVGAVLIQDGRVVGEGWHERYGSAHAEVNALTAAGSLARGATLFVTLEPCRHHGKTGPCTEAIQGAGVKRVCAAMADPFEAVAGQGLEELRQAGLQVEVGLGEVEARRLNAPYLKLLARGRPYVHAKWAMSLDGKLATRVGDSRWISGESSRRRVHTLRGLMDAVIIGAGTARRDNPLLTARPPGPRTPARIVVGDTASISLDSRLAGTIPEAPLILASNRAPEERIAASLRARGAELLTFPGLDHGGLVSGLLDELGRRRMTNVLVEGGSAALASFLDIHEIDEVHVFVAPILIGGAGAPSPCAGKGVEKISDALQLLDCSIEQIDADFLLQGQVRTSSSDLRAREP